MGKHTPEPWVISGACVAAESDQLNNGFYVAICKGQDQRENARRIAACVNACEGMSNEELEGGILLGVMEKRIATLEKRRDELSSLLLEAQRYVRYRLEYTECDARIVMGLIADIDAAIAKAKGGAA
ncbi:hypothetical protein [Aeromonas sp. L_1B5_3]|uniref:hypothetical protein n=1 Tax=Aeromonas sp. L_1B5_3 TaxID=1588629 RepID=UPI0005B6D1FA|nr:hypothetical protein [Aeromonas sp. L_1B5_3]KIQ77878.1 hypothetical protein RW26_19455 [Aeromonas sp. L_1B5_3]